jgi:kynureninase
MITLPDTPTREHCLALDRADPLASLRAEFVLPEDMIYLDGNSLGARPRAALARALDIVEREWGEDLITSWNRNGWFRKAYELGDLLAPMIGAGPGEVVVTDSTGIDLHKALQAAIGLAPAGRRRILMEGSNFPTNNYMTQGVAAQLPGCEVVFTEGEGIAQAIDERLSVLCLTHVHYKTGAIHDMAALTARAQAAGALVIWDLCHSAGVLPVDLNGCNADFAVGCTYKYLNGGPGSPAFIFAATRHHAEMRQPLTGWWGHAEPFAFERDFRPRAGIGRMLSGTQPILSLGVTECGLQLARRADMRDVRAKSMVLTGLFIQLVEARCAAHGFRLVSPRDPQRRGSQVSFDHEQGYAIVQALIAAGVVGDFRAPANMRFGFAPLYNRFVDVWDAVERLADIMDSGRWRDPAFATRSAVT